MLRVFQSVRGLSDDSVTRLDKNDDLALEMRDLTVYQCYNQPYTSHVLDPHYK